MSKRLITCRLCSLTFEAVSEQQDHFKSKFHRHNLRRKLCGLAVVNQDEFNKFMETAHAIDTGETKVEDFTCDICAKHFSTENQLKNHMQSKRHRKMADQGQSTSEDNSSKNADETADSTDRPPAVENSPSVDPSVSRARICLFCDEVSPDCLGNIEHMYEAHGFIVPFLERVTSLEGLISYLREKMETLHQCLSCESQRFTSLDAVRKHMIDKRHLGFDPVQPNENGKTAYDLMEYYDIPESIMVDGECVYIEEEEDEDNEGYEDYEMCLPSGATIGHRSLKIYYRQRFNGNHILCMSGRKQLECPAKEKLFRRQMAEQQRAYKSLNELRKRYFVSLGVKANKLQPHFRHQVLF